MINCGHMLKRIRGVTLSRLFCKSAVYPCVPPGGLGYCEPFRLLHFRHKTCALLGIDKPPCDNGLMWSRVKSLVEWQIVQKGCNARIVRDSSCHLLSYPRSARLGLLRSCNLLQASHRAALTTTPQPLQGLGNTISLYQILNSH